MYPDFSIILDEKPNLNEKNHELSWNCLTMKPKKIEQKILGVHKEKLARLVDRTLLLLSFKDTQIQNLQTVLQLIEINTLEEKKNILHEIFRLIQEGIIYIPNGLPQLIQNGLDINQLKNIDLCLLRPYDQIIKEIQEQITELEEK